jgi:geranylgeranyl pyrophosphate synthase
LTEVEEDAFMSFVSEVRELTVERLEKAASVVVGSIEIGQLMPGKMLRSSLAGRLVEGGCFSVDRGVLVSLCAATEIVHTASLLHDDVVDNAMVRRAGPALWRTSSPSGAILIGDLLLCEAIEMLVGTEGGSYLNRFISKVTEVIEAETEQELLFRGKQLDEDTCLRLARNKTGPLFAFVASICGGDDKRCSQSLEEAGYCIGTAYQLADDCLDLAGDEQAVGKTLGTDSKRGKFTLPQGGGEGVQITQGHVRRLCGSALEAVGEYGKARDSLIQFFTCDFQPAVAGHIDVCMEFAV